MFHQKAQLTDCTVAEGVGLGVDALVSLSLLEVVVCSVVTAVCLRCL